MYYTTGFSRDEIVDLCAMINTLPVEDRESWPPILGLFKAVREQKQLEITPAQPVLVLWRHCYDQHGRILDLTHRVVVGERHELVYRYDSTT